MATEHCVIPFKTPFTAMMVGQTMSGKSNLMSQILVNNKELFDTPPVEIMYVYKVWGPLFEQMKREISNIEFSQTIPTKQVCI